MRSLQSLWGTPHRPTASVPEGWYRAAVVRGELLADEHGDFVYCVAFLFLEPAVLEAVRPPFAVFRIPLVDYRMGEARRLLKRMGIESARQLREPLPGLYARPSREAERIPAHSFRADRRIPDRLRPRGRRVGADIPRNSSTVSRG